MRAPLRSAELKESMNSPERCRVEIRIKDNRRIIIEFYGGRR